MGYDIIGDVHGHANELEGLLKHLGYEHRRGAWRHSDRTAIFVGDLIDRGPGQLRTLELVRAMQDAGTAEIVMGNHEFNAIAWATRDPRDEDAHLRPRRGPRGETNRRQHEAFLSEVGPDSAEHNRWIDWMLDLPLWIERPTFRVIHACWSPKDVEFLKPHLRDQARLDRALVEAASRKGSDAYQAVEVLLKGVEVALPADWAYADKEGHHRDAIRTQWWNPELSTYSAAYIGPSGMAMPDLPIEGYEPPPEPDRPTFIGHYWFNPENAPAPASRRVACVDYSVANGGPLVAYRFDGEPEIVAEKFVRAAQ
jgi:hypothetical protein